MSSPSFASISAQTLYELSERQPVDLIDVRTPAEFREVHATVARNVPLDSLDPAAVIRERNGAADRPLYVICKSGGRSAMACAKLAAAGFTNVVDVEGGTAAWDKAGLPVCRGKRAVSLDRQVRGVAGAIVVAGVTLGWGMHPYWYALPAWIGLGLVFSGVTDTCPMGMLLAKMPWNR